jgi:hypothetical protein
VDADTAPKTFARAAFAAATVSAAAFAAFILGAHLQPDLGPRFGLSVADFANWNVAMFATAIVGGLAIGRIARRLGTRVALGAVLFVATVGMLLIASADSATAAFVGRLAAAFAFGGTWGTTNRWRRPRHPPTHARAPQASSRPALPPARRWLPRSTRGSDPRRPPCRASKPSADPRSASLRSASLRPQPSSGFRARFQLPRPRRASRPARASTDAP